MEFSPNNNVVRLCIQGMALEGTDKPDEARALFLRAWHEATDDAERFYAAYVAARGQQDPADKLRWFQTALECALRANDDSLKPAFPSLHRNLAACYEKLHDADNASKHLEAARTFNDTPSDKGPFYHGTRADLHVGDLLTGGNSSNYSPGLIMNHIYFTALVNGAGLAAALASGPGRERVYIVEPTGVFEHDPNVTDKKFPGNPTRSYRSQAPLRIVGETTDWVRQTPERLAEWRARLANVKGDIIN